MSPELQKRIEQLAADRVSGASEILEEALAILGDALGGDAAIVEVARAVVNAQPSMASIVNAALAAVAGRDRFDRFAQRVARAPEALVRFSVECFGTGGRDRSPLRLATISYSRTVLHVLERLAGERPLRVACSESRPALEGRRLAVRLATAGTPVTYFSDAAIGHALGGVDAVLVGADAVAPEWFLNKSGTRMLASVAAQQGVPVYVLASRDKFVSHLVAGRLEAREGAPAEIWEGAPARVTVRNPYFESTPLDLVASVITDIGVLGAAAVADVCEATARETPPGLLGQL